MRFDGHNGGIAAGRACWMVGTDPCLCHQNTGGRPIPCHACDFYRRVMFEEKERASFMFSVETA